MSRNFFHFYSHMNICLFVMSEIENSRDSSKLGFSTRQGQLVSRVGRQRPNPHVPFAKKAAMAPWPNNRYLVRCLALRIFNASA